MMDLSSQMISDSWRGILKTERIGPIRLEDAYAINEHAERIFWQRTYFSRPYYDKNLSFEKDYEPIYRFGWESRKWFYDRHFDEVEDLLRQAWSRQLGQNTTMDWSMVRVILKDAWENVDYNN